MYINVEDMWLEGKFQLLLIVPNLKNILHNARQQKLKRNAKLFLSISLHNRRREKNPPKCKSCIYENLGSRGGNQRRDKKVKIKTRFEHFTILSLVFFCFVFRGKKKWGGKCNNPNAPFARANFHFRRNREQQKVHWKAGEAQKVLARRRRSDCTTVLVLSGFNEPENKNINLQHKFLFSSFIFFFCFYNIKPHFPIRLFFWSCASIIKKYKQPIYALCMFTGSRLGQKQKVKKETTAAYVVEAFAAREYPSISALGWWWTDPVGVS